MNFHLLTAVFLLPLTLLAQNSAPDPDSTFISFTTEEAIDHQWPEKHIDTSLISIEGYDVIRSDNAFHTSTGNYGSPAFPRVYSPVSETGFHSGLTFMDVYRLKERDIKYYNAFSPYSELGYVQGLSSLQIFDALFTVNVNPSWNIGADIKLTGSEGFYQNQGANQNQYHFFNNFLSKNQRYRVLAHSTWNSFITRENGGLVSDSLFENSSIGEKTRLSTHLSTARMTWKDFNAGAKQYYYFGSYDSIYVEEDSTFRSRLKPVAFISHRINFDRTIHGFSVDASDMDYFTHAIIDTSITDDSTAFSRIRNEISLSSAPGSDSLYGTLSLEHAYVKFDQRQLGFAENHLAGKASLKWTVKKKLWFRTSAEYQFRGYVKGNYKAGLSLGQTIKTSRFFLAISALRSQPAFTDQYYHSNNYVWLRNLEDERIVRAEASVHSSRINGHLTAHFFHILNYTYIDSNLTPRQFKEGVQYLRLHFNKSFHSGRTTWKNELVYQQEMGSDILHLPLFMYKTSLFATRPVFKNALLARAGVEAHYFSAYQPYSYLPGIGKRSFQSEIKIGNYPVINVFVSGKVNRFIGFLKMEHINQFMHDRYYLLPHYPANPFRFTFGMKWSFMD